MPPPKTFRKNWASEAAFLRKQANKLKVLVAELEVPSEIDLLLRVINNLEERALRVEPVKPAPVKDIANA